MQGGPVQWYDHNADGNRTNARMICPSCQSAASGAVDLDPKSNAESAHPVPHEGRIAIVTDAGWDAVDAAALLTNSASLRTAKSCGPDASTLAFKLVAATLLATVTTKPDHRGEHEGNR
jgi:hypothetical protein